MKNIIFPPEDWIKNPNKTREYDIYSLIMKNYQDNDVLFKVFKNDGKLKELTKKECIFRSKLLANQILSSIGKNKKTQQIKIFGVLKASEESVILMLTSLLIGAHHCICFEDLSEEAIVQRVKIFNPNIILSRLNLKEKIRSIANRYHKKDIALLPIDLSQSESSSDLIFDNNSYAYNQESDLFTLFTSGSTGVPKAVIHGVYNYLEYSRFSTSYFFGITKGKTIFTATDAGWINGHTYAFYGPLLLGGTSVINENPIGIALPNVLAKILNATNPNCFYTSVTTLRLLMSAVKPKQTISDYNIRYQNIERIGSCGEPLADTVGKWAIQFFQPKRKSIVNTYFQTETGGVLVAPRDEDNIPSDYSSVGKPRKELGLVIAKNIMSKSDLHQESIDPDEILICNPWDGIFKQIISSSNSSYFTKSGNFRLHDIGYFDAQGFLYIGGRSDDVINVAGHRISSSEVESISLSLESINEACAVAVPDSIYGSRVVLYFSSEISNKESLAKICLDLKNLIKEKLTQYHIPKNIYNFNNLPKTKSGKIMRRLMKSISEKHHFDESKDYSTLANKDDFLKSVRYLLDENTSDNRSNNN